MHTSSIPSTERDLSDLTSANHFLDEMAELILAHHVNLPPTIHHDTDRVSMHVSWPDLEPWRAHIVVQANNGSMGSVWLANTHREGDKPGYSHLTSHVGIAVGQLLERIGLG